MNIFIILLLILIISYLSKISRNKTKKKNCPECKSHRHLTKKRILHLDSLNLDFNNKTVLEINAKDTSLSRYLLSKNAKVSLSNFNKKFLNKLKKNKFNINILELDIEKPIKIPKFDYIICYGVIEGVQNPIKAVKWISKYCNTFILDTSVSNLYDYNILNVLTKKKKIASRFSRQTIYDLLKNNFSHVYTTVKQPEHEYYPNNWKNINKELHLSLKIRCLFIASNELLIENKNLQFHIENYQK